MTENDAQPGFFKRLRARLNRGDSWLTRDITEFVPGGRIDDETLEEIETRLLMADVGVDTTENIMGALNKNLARKEKRDAEALRDGLQRTLTDVLKPGEAPLVVGDKRPFVLLMVGVNGAGKPTTAAKPFGPCSQTTASSTSGSASPSRSAAA